MFHDPISCPCCSRPVQGSMSADLLGLMPVQEAILRAVSAGKGQAVPTESILRAIYGDDDNPPDPSRQYATFKEKLSIMRSRLADAGLAIETVGRGEGYRLVRVATHADRAT